METFHANSILSFRTIVPSTLPPLYKLFQSAELQALRTLLEEESSLEETVVRIKKLRGEIAKLKLREQRFAVDPVRHSPCQPALAPVCSDAV